MNKPSSLFKSKHLIFPSNNKFILDIEKNISETLELNYELKILFNLKF